MNNTQTIGKKRIISVNGKLYDTGTSNKSFLQVAMDLNTLGVNEWYFMLEIKDPSLINVDPFAVNEETGEPALTKDQISRITIECVHNIWYYLREIVRIPSAGAPEGVPYIANRGNIAQTWCLLHGLDSWLCLPRQQGKTKSALAAQSWAYSFGTAHATFIFINKDADNAKTNLSDFADIIGYLPKYLRYEFIMEEDGKITKARKSATKLEHPITHNVIKVRAKATSYEAAIGLGRGLSAPFLHFDEVEFTPFIDVIIENSVSTYETSARKSKERGALYGRIFTSTPGDTDTDPGRRGEELLKKCCIWDDSFYNKPIEELERLSFADKKMGVFYMEYSYQQIGLTYEWFKYIAAKIGNMITVRREILLQRLRGSSRSPYDRDDIDKIIELAKKPIRMVMLNKYYRLDIYEELNRGIPYIVGIDCATGTNNDSNAMSIINPYTTALVAEFECSYVGEPEFIKVIIELVSKYIPRAIICIERNHVGDSIIAFLLQSKIAGRLYFDKFKKLAEERMEDLSTVESMLKKKAREKTYYGVFTEQKSREVMFGILADRIKTDKDKFVGQNVTRDITKLIQRGAKIVAQEPWHDDSIMSYLIGMYVYFYGNNLESFGFSKSDFLYQDELNTGMIRPEDIDLSSVPDSVAEFVETDIARNSGPSYEDMLYRTIMREQQKEALLHSKGLVTNAVLDNTLQGDPTYEIDDDTDMSFLDELNNPNGYDSDTFDPFANNDGDDIFGIF